MQAALQPAMACVQARLPYPSAGTRPAGAGVGRLMAIATIDARHLSRDRGPVHPPLWPCRPGGARARPASDWASLLRPHLTWHIANEQLAGFLGPQWGGQRPSGQGLSGARQRSAGPAPALILRRDSDSTLASVLPLSMPRSRAEGKSLNIKETSLAAALPTRLYSRLVYEAVTMRRPAKRRLYRSLGLVG